MFRKPCILRHRWLGDAKVFSSKHELPIVKHVFVLCCKFGGFTKTLYFTASVALSPAGEYNWGYIYICRFATKPLGEITVCF